MTAELKEITEKDQNLKWPKMYKVAILNDDFTPINFVTKLLTTLFYLSQDEADSVASEAHKSGKAVAGIFSKDIAETKAYQVFYFAQSYGHPLRAIAEQE